MVRARPATVAAVIPVFASDRALDVARATLRHVDELVLVDDGAPEPIARSLDELAGDERVRILRQGQNGGKGSAVAAGRGGPPGRRQPARRSSCSTPTDSTTRSGYRPSSRRAARRTS